MQSVWRGSGVYYLKDGVYYHETCGIEGEKHYLTELARGYDWLSADAIIDETLAGLSLSRQTEYGGLTASQTHKLQRVCDRLRIPFYATLTGDGAETIGSFAVTW